MHKGSYQATYVYECESVEGAVCLGFPLTSKANIPFIYISIKRFPTALGCLLFLSQDIRQETDNHVVGPD